MHILTFDIEDWFHLLEHPGVRHEAQWDQLERRLPAMVDRLLDLLDQHEQRASFFCLGWVARQMPVVIRRIVERGHEIGSHSDVHSLLFEQSRDQFRAELRLSRDVLEQAAGRPVVMFRAPGFSLVPGCEWAFAILAEEGFAIDCSIFPAGRAHGGFRSFPFDRPGWVDTAAGPVKEFPMTVGRLFGQPVVFSGGGYFRLLPLPVLHHLWKRSSYTMSYFHPRDFEPDQPVLGGLGPLRRFKSYFGLGRAEAKLRAILAGHRFVSVGQADRAIDWAAAPRTRFGG